MNEAIGYVAADAPETAAALLVLAGGLVDQLHLMIGPAFPGGGTPVFEGQSRVQLRLLDSRTLEDSELVLARYGVRH